MNSELRNRLIQDLEDEINMNRAGCMCAPRHVKMRCRKQIKINQWKISRLKNGKNIDIEPPIGQIGSW